MQESSASISEQIETYKTFQEGVIKEGGRNCWMAVHAMVAALQPNILCNVLSEDKLDNLFKLLKDVSSEEQGESRSKTSKESENSITLIFQNGEDSPWESLKNEWDKSLEHQKDNLSWYIKSAAILKYFKKCHGNGKEWNPDTPWQVLMALTGDERIKTIEKRLEIQNNIILTGAPGTGKTFLAQKGVTFKTLC